MLSHPGPQPWEEDGLGLHYWAGPTVGALRCGGLMATLCALTAAAKLISRLSVRSKTHPCPLAKQHTQLHTTAR